MPTDPLGVMARERSDARQAAIAFVHACEAGKVDRIQECARWLNDCIDAWSIAMRMVARLQRVTSQVQQAFVSVWVEHKHLPLACGHRPICAAALRILMPGEYSGPPVTVYRGTHALERRRRTYGFSWSNDVAVARKFAQSKADSTSRLGRSLFTTGVVLQATVLPEAVLLIRRPEDFCDEGEVVVDPYRLGKISVAEKI